MDEVIMVLEDVGEVGIASDASPGNGQYYVKTYDGFMYSVGYETFEDAWDELCYIGELQ